MSLPTRSSSSPISPTGDPWPSGASRTGAGSSFRSSKPGRSYQYRYRLLKDGAVDYRNDERPDGLVGNVMGTENAVLTV